jgi:hypothetical protein
MSRNNLAYIQENDESRADYDLICWYLNVRRIVELVGDNAIAEHLSSALTGATDDHLTRSAKLTAAKDALVSWMNSTRPPTLGKLLLSGEAVPEKMFTQYSNVYCRDLPKCRMCLMWEKSLQFDWSSTLNSITFGKVALSGSPSTTNT